jgi:hypothetical protein
MASLFEIMDRNESNSKVSSFSVVNEIAIKVNLTVEEVRMRLHANRSFINIQFEQLFEPRKRGKGSLMRDLNGGVLEFPFPEESIPNPLPLKSAHRGPNHSIRSNAVEVVIPISTRIGKWRLDYSMSRPDARSPTKDIGDLLPVVLDASTSLFLPEHYKKTQHPNANAMHPVARVEDANGMPGRICKVSVVRFFFSPSRRAGF